MTAAPKRHARPRTPAHELRRRLSDTYHAYLSTLPHALAPDARTLRLLDELVVAAAALRNAVADELGII